MCSWQKTRRMWLTHWKQIANKVGLIESKTVCIKGGWGANKSKSLGSKAKAVRPCCGSIFLFVLSQTRQQQLYQVIFGEQSHQQRLFTCFAKFLSIWCALVILLAFSRLAPIIDYKKCHKVIPIRFFSDSFGGNHPWQLKTDGIYLIPSFCDPDCITIPNNAVWKLLCTKR